MGWVKNKNNAPPSAKTAHMHAIIISNSSTFVGIRYEQVISSRLFPAPARQRTRPPVCAAAITAAPAAAAVYDRKITAPYALTACSFNVYFQVYFIVYKDDRSRSTSTLKKKSWNIFFFFASECMISGWRYNYITYGASITSNILGLQ